MVARCKIFEVEVRVLLTTVLSHAYEQLAASRLTADTLLRASAHTDTSTVPGNGSSTAMVLSPWLTLPASGVDTVQTTWATNPFASLPESLAAGSAVVEMTVRSATTGVDIPLRSSAALSGNPMPVHFWVELSAGTCVAAKLRCWHAV